MRRFSQLGNLVNGLTAVVFLAGCSGANSPVAASSGQLLPRTNANRTVQAGAINRTIIASARLPFVPLPQFAPVQSKEFVDVARVSAPGGNEVITSDIGTGSILIFGGDGKLNGLIVKGLNVPEGMTTDSAQTLYVANTGAGNIFIYHKPYNSLSQTLDDPDQLPLDVAVSSTGLVGVTNLVEPTGGFGSVSFYAKGSTTACANVSSPFWARVYFGSFDAAGNLFIDGLDPVGNTVVGKISGGCKATSITTLTTQNKIVAPGGLQVANGQILIADQTNKALYSYSIPAGTSLGSPTATTNLSPASDPLGIAVRVLDKNVWVADATYFANATEYAYPSGSVVKSAYAQVALIGIAVNPAAKP